MKCIGLTIGPIIKTLGMARKTREIWSASYLFSFMMRTLMEKLVEKGINKEDIIVPNSSAIGAEPVYAFGGGLYPDRLIFRSKPGDRDKLKAGINETLDIIAGGIAGHISQDQAKVRHYLDSYLRLTYIEIEVAENDSPILAFSPYLDTMELRENYLHRDHESFLATFLEKKDRPGFLFNDAFARPPEGVERKYAFQSIIEIAAGELANEIGQDKYKAIIKKSFTHTNEDEYVISQLKQALKDMDKQKLFKTRHKYIAIVQADGDDFKKTIEGYGNDHEKLAEFSSNLIHFASDAARMIHDHGGAPIYIGGDDLFFFAPVTGIFCLIDRLDERFQKDFPKNSLSYGLSISYYKFPLNEAREEAYRLMEDSAKKMPGKDALAFKVLKHSGRAFGTVMRKNSGIYRQFEKLMEQYGENEKYLNSIVYTAEFHKGILAQIGENRDRVVHFFNNSFDEEIHDRNQAFVTAAAELFHDVYTQSPGSWSSKEKFDCFYSLLRTLHFLNRGDTDNE